MDDRNSTARAAVINEAADWYARLRAGDMSELDAVRFRGWLASDPERRGEFEALDALWDGIGALENSVEVKRERGQGTARRLGFAAVAANAPTRRWAIAAAVVLSISALLITREYNAGRYETAVGEQRSVLLEDGSVITLNTASDVRVSYSKSRRDVELIAGQANFEVAKQASRPFIVSSGGGQVRAVGTVFDVYKSESQVTVTLLEGKVVVAPVSSRAADRQGAAADVVLTEGEQVSYVNGSVSAPLDNVDLPRITAWRSRKLDFSDTPLQEAIAEANRYSHEKIVLEAPQLQGARISGTFEAGKNDLLAEGLQAYFHVDIDRSGAGRIVLTPRRE